MRLFSVVACPVLTLGLVAVAAPGVQADASTTATASCQPLLKKAKKAARKGQKAKAKRLRSQHRTCKAAIAVRTQLAGYTFTGTRGDGQPVTITLCSNGAWESRTGSRPVGISSGTNWFVRNTTFTNATTWVTQVGENQDRRKGGWGVGFARDGDSFQVGIAYFDGVTDLGGVTRSPAACG